MSINHSRDNCVTRAKDALDQLEEHINIKCPDITEWAVVDLHAEENKISFVVQSASGYDTFTISDKTPFPKGVRKRK